MIVHFEITCQNYDDGENQGFFMRECFLKLRTKAIEKMDDELPYIRAFEWYNKWYLHLYFYFSSFHTSNFDVEIQ